MTKKCNFCGNKNFEEKLVEYIYRKENKLLLVKNVPAEVCEYCGEQYFKAGILKKIETDFNEIHYSGKKANGLLKVPVEDYTAL
jgi:YgiT-type zinc finger domain-containing protein